MKKLFILISLITLCIGTYSCGGGGAGPADVPSGENPGLPTVVQLSPAQYVAQTGSYIYLSAKVLDGNGMVVPDINVTFVNLSQLGVLSSARAKTNGLGVATVSLYSIATGFVTVQVNISTAAGQITTKKTVYFSTYDLTWPTSASPQPFMSLYVDGDNDGAYNEQSDFTIFDGSGDNQVKVLAVVYDGTGSVVSGSTVTFSSDSTTEVTFPLGSTRTTDSNGTASVLVQVDPSILTTLTTTVNITAEATVGSSTASNMVTLYIYPVTISSVSISASPTSISTDGTSSIIAAVKTSAGTPAPDGTTVIFTAACPPLVSVAQIDPPFAQTTSGKATATFHAPSQSNSCTATASCGGLSATTYITVAAPSAPVTPTTPEALTIVPGSVTVVRSTTTKQTVSFTISGGTSPYTTTSADLTRAFNDDGAGGGTAGNGVRDGSEGGVWTGSSSTITVTIPISAPAGTVTLTVYDSKGNTKSATITIQCASAPSVSPTSDTICEVDNTCSAGKTTATFTISGGTAPYNTISNNTSVIANPGAANPFTVDAFNGSITADTNVTFTITDSNGCSATATVAVKNQ